MPQNLQTSISVRNYGCSPFILVVCFFGLVNTLGATTRTALVIGNWSYKSAPLRNPVNDARDVTKALRSLKFDVIERLNANEKEMVLAIDEFYKRLKLSDVGVFYFAGHGMQIQGVNFLIPVKAQVTSETDLQFEAVDAGRVLEKMRAAGNKLNIVILDACRDNPFKRSFRSGNKGLAQMDAPKGTIIAYATSPGSVAADGSGRNGVYTEHLLRHLHRFGMSVYDIFRETGLGVMKETGEKQIPWISSTPVQKYFIAGVRSSGSENKERYFAEEQAKLNQRKREPKPLKVEIAQEKKNLKRKTKKIVFVSSRKSNKFHLPSCKWARKISDKNKLVFESNQEVLNDRLVPCKTCKP